MAKEELINKLSQLDRLEYYAKRQEVDSTPYSFMCLLGGLICFLYVCGLLIMIESNLVPSDLSLVSIVVGIIAGFLFVIVGFVSSYTTIKSLVKIDRKYFEVIPK